MPSGSDEAGGGSGDDADGGSGSDSPRRDGRGTYVKIKYKIK